MAEIYYGKNYIRQVLGRDVAVDETIVKQTVEEVTSEKIDEVVNNAPEELDTLGEVADAIKTNANSIDSISNDVERLNIKIAGWEAGGMVDDGEDWDAMNNFEINSLVNSIFD